MKRGRRELLPWILCDHRWRVVGFERVEALIGYRCELCGRERFEPVDVEPEPEPPRAA